MNIKEVKKIYLVKYLDYININKKGANGNFIDIYFFFIYYSLLIIKDISILQISTH